MVIQRGGNRANYFQLLNLQDLSFSEVAWTVIVALEGGSGTYVPTSPVQWDTMVAVPIRRWML